GSRAASELVETRCERGAEIVLKLGLGLRSAETVRALDEHWDGSGHPRGLSGDEIPMLARIAGLAQVVERFLVSDGVAAALEIATQRSGRWFDPMLVRALIDSGRRLADFGALDEAGLREAVRAAEPGAASLLAGPGTL